MDRGFRLELLLGPNSKRFKLSSGYSPCSVFPAEGCSVGGDGW